MLHELLSALLGHTGGIFIRGERQVKVLQVPFLHPTELGLLSRLCETATYYCNFLDFLVENNRQPYAGDATPVPAGGFYMRALCAALEQVLEPYVQTILKLEHDLLDSPYLSLTHVQHVLSEFQLLFPAISSLLDQIVHSKARGCQLLEIVHRECSSGDPTVQKAMLRLQMVLHVTMYKQLSTWLLHGMLLDTYDEFFIGKEKSADTAVATAAAIGADEATTPRDEQLPTAGTSVDHQSEQSAAGQGPTEAAVCSDSKYALRIPMLPSYIPVGTAKKILFVGESVLMLESEQRQIGSHLSRATILRDKENEFARALHDLSEEEVFDLAKFDSIIDRIRSCVAERLWKLVVVDADLAGHLKLMKDFFLLGRGELFQAFIDSANWILRGPPHMATEHDVNSVFQQASRSVLFEDEAVLRHFSLTVSGRASQPAAAAAAARPRATAASGAGTQAVPVPPQPSAAAGAAAAAAAAETGWSALGLRYAVQWPLHVLFTPLAMERYNALFKFLLLVRRTQLQLHGCWTRQMNRKHRREAPTEDATRWQLRVHMSFLIDNLQYYLLADVIESQFAGLLERTRTCNDFEAVQHAHDGFLASLLAQSFLLMKPVAHCIAEILDTCQSFCALMEQVGPDLTADEWAQLQAIKKSFQLQSGLLFRLLSSVRSHQIHPHLAQLLLRIDYNRYLSAADGHLGGKPV